VRKLAIIRHGPLDFLLMPALHVRLAACTDWGSYRGGAHGCETKRCDHSKRCNQSAEPGERNRLALRNLSSTFMSPFTLLQRIFNDDVASLLTGVNSQRDGTTSQPKAASGRSVAWAPKIDVVQRGNELLIRADLPGVNADDVVVEIGDDSIAISGERREQRAEENDGIFRYETTYGAFFREIPLPEWALVDQAKASCKDGVLEIAVPAPPADVSRGRRLDISRGEQSNTGEQSNPVK
jgi:HSP20 family molecular chaperone IbpA